MARSGYVSTINVAVKGKEKVSAIETRVNLP